MLVVWLSLVDDLLRPSSVTLGTTWLNGLSNLVVQPKLINSIDFAAEESENGKMSSKK